MGFLIWVLIGLLTSIYWIAVLLPKNEKRVSYIIMLMAISFFFGPISTIVALVHYTEHKGWSL